LKNDEVKQLRDFFKSDEDVEVMRLKKSEKEMLTL